MMKIKRRNKTHVLNQVTEAQFLLINQKKEEGHKANKKPMVVILRNSIFLHS